jgi:hypothetical protein
MNYKILIIIITTLVSQVISFVVGYNTGVAQTHRDAYENGLMTMQHVGDARIYRWLETHKIGYDYND